MKVHVALVGWLCALAANADTVHLTNGKQVNGKVTSFWNMQFEVVATDGAVTRYQLPMVQRIEFDGATATLDTRNKGKLTGSLISFEKTAFTIKSEKGLTEQVSITFVKEASFGAGGGGDSGKDVEQVRGTDLTKYLAAGKVTVVDFYADWCGPCRMISPVLEKLAKDDDKVVLRKVNVDQNRALAQKFKVSGIPHIVIFDGKGREVGTVVGADPNGVKQLVDKAKKS